MHNDYKKFLVRQWRDREQNVTGSPFALRVRNEVLACLEPPTVSDLLETPEELEPLRMWEFVPGTGESVRISSVVDSIRAADPEDLHQVMLANRCLPRNEQFFVDYRKVVQDAYKLSIMLRNPEAYVRSVNRCIVSSLSQKSVFSIK